MNLTPPIVYPFSLNETEGGYACRVFATQTPPSISPDEAFALDELETAAVVHQTPQNIVLRSINRSGPVYNCIHSLLAGGFVAMKHSDSGRLICADAPGGDRRTLNFEAVKTNEAHRLLLQTSYKLAQQLVQSDLKLGEITSGAVNVTDITKSWLTNAGRPKITIMLKDFKSLDHIEEINMEALSRICKNVDATGLYLVGRVSTKEFRVRQFPNWRVRRKIVSAKNIEDAATGSAAASLLGIRCMPRTLCLFQGAHKETPCRIEIQDLGNNSCLAGGYVRYSPKEAFNDQHRWN